MKGLINNFIKGLFKNTSSKEQPEGTTRFTLNAVNNTYEGNLGALANENSNGECFSLPEGYMPLGKVYIGDGEVAILSTKIDSVLDEIGIVNDNCEYKTHVRANLGFKITNQIDVTYRLRRGCDKTIYWVDGKNNQPMNYNFNDPSSFKTGGLWDKKKFNLALSYEVYPEFTSLEILDGSGSLLSGSYNIGIQLLDTGLNATPIIFTSPTINIYKDNISDNYLDVSGSITTAVPAYTTTPTSKAISITSIVDESYAFYRLVFIEYVSGDGSLTNVKYSAPIPTANKEYIYDGDNYETLGDIQEVLVGDDRVLAAESIEQIDNRLILGNTYGNTESPCKLQEIVSKINVDLAIKKVSGNSISPGNTKHPLVNFDSVGYMPGEIYSIGLVPVYEDNTEGPVYHIPGRPISADNVVFSPGTDIYPMSIDNLSATNTYTDNSSCDSGNYWGKDSFGNDLVGTKIRHHRFPYRSDIGVPMVEETSSSTQTQVVSKIILSLIGTIDVPCSLDQVAQDICPSENIAEPFQVRIKLLVNGIVQYEEFTVNPEDLAQYPDLTVDIDYTEETGEYDTVDIVVDSIEEYDGSWVIVPDTTVSNKGIIYSTELQTDTYSKTKNTYITNVYGIKLSNVDIAGMNAVSNKKIIGYHIVRNERRESDKTILDSAILTPCVNSDTTNRLLNGYQDGDSWGENIHPENYSFLSKNLSKDFLANGLLSPVFDRNHIDDTYSRGPVIFEGHAFGQEENFLEYDKRVSKTYFGLLNPRYKFDGKEYDSPYRIKQEGLFNVKYRRYDGLLFRDTFDGTSYDKDIHITRGDKFYDDDGFALRGITRDSKLEFTLGDNTTYPFNFSQSEIQDISYLEAVHNKSYPGLQEDFYNLSGDNRTGILKVEDSAAIEGNMKDIFPYVYLEKNTPDPYSDFRSAPFYKVTSKLETGNESKVFGGDVFITPLRYNNTVFLDNQYGLRIPKNKTWKIILGAFLTVIVVIASFFTVGLASPLLKLTIGMIQSGIKEQKLIEAYKVQYARGLKECLMDADTFNGLKWNPTEDDEVHWFSDVLTDVWYESEVNISLRYGFSDETEPSFLAAPGEVYGSSRAPRIQIDLIKYYQNSYIKLHRMAKRRYEPQTEVGKYLRDKLLYSDTDRKDNLAYYGHSKGEIYNINPDFDRMNKEKVFFHLGIEYDCCSDCQEEFPHRIWYSEQSFQEELSDNYKTFLPYNYRDIEGESGRITDLFTMQNNLYIHTEEALWHLPQNYQERVTDQLVTYIGTGEFFAIPPRKILDDEQQSGGSSHKWATIKIGEHGVFFVSERSRKIFKFDGKNLRPINSGLDNWFKNNIPLQFPKYFKDTYNTEFTLINNPSNPEGIGFISIYDQEKERLIITKKDWISRPSIVEEGSSLVFCEGSYYIYTPDEGIIEELTPDWYEYIGISGCNLEFAYRRNPYETILVPIPNSLLTPYDNSEVSSSWTLSYSLEASKQEDVWVSWHSYLPSFYARNNSKFISWIGDNSNTFWEHNIKDSYQEFYGKKYPFIVEFVSADKDLKTKLWEYISIRTQATKFNTTLQEHKEERFVTFNKAIFYNSRQSSGELNIVVKDTKPLPQDYLIQQVQNLSGDTIIIDKDEKDWHINDLRDYVINQDEPLFDKNKINLQPDYFIDKIVNNNVIDHNKDWFDVESFRDKYLTIRLIFDNFDDVKLLFTHAISHVEDSER